MHYAQVMNPDRRAFRFVLDAAAEVASAASPNATMNARATELSLRGCYLQVSSTFDVETPVLVKIFHASEYFEAKGAVVYIKLHAGMGIAFNDIKPACQSTLQKWILAALHNQARPE